jgi:hypothetical protein
MESDRENIQGYEGYKITRGGKVWSDKSNRYLKQRLCNGYYIISLLNKSYTVHRLVAQAFIPNSDNKPYVNHINCDKTDNRVENLEWVTQKENCEAHDKSISHPRRVIQMDLDGNEIATFNSITEAGESIGKTRHAVNKVCIGKNKTAGGFKWKYENEEHNYKEIDITQAKQVYDYDNYYVFSDGQIFNKQRKSYLKPVKNAAGYCYVTFSRNTKKKNCYIQRIVADHFLVKGDKNLVNHINGIKDDNRLENLEWVTYSENSINAKKSP